MRQTPSKRGEFFGNGHLGAAELAVMPTLHLATELVRHRLLAVTNAEHRYSGVVYGLRRKRRVLVENRSGAAGQDDRLGFISRKAASAFW